MKPLDTLIACVGQWRGTNVLQDPITERPDESSSTATVIPLLDGRFVRIDYTWAYQGAPQEGSLLIGHQTKEETTTCHWIDGWHNGERVMALEGTTDDAGVVTVTGHYPAPTGPDWGWRLVVTPVAGDSLTFIHHNLSPDGEEWLAIEMTYAPLD